jgi:cobalt-zinc-cadmium efflux system outer membrane protein
MGAAGTAGETQGLFVQQEIILGGKLRLSRAKYTQEAAQAEIQAVAQEFRIRNGIRIRFLEVLAAEQMLATQRDLAKNAQETTLTTAEMLNAGQANRPDFLQAQVASQRARVMVLDKERDYQVRWNNLATLVGVPDLPPTPLDGTLETKDLIFDSQATLCKLLEESPEVQAARAEVVKDEITLRRERAEPIPNVCVQANTGYNYETRNAVATVAIGFRIPVFDRNQGTIQQARADLARSHAEVNRVELSLRRRLGAILGRYEVLRSSAKDYREASLPKLKEAYDLQQEMYRKGRQDWPHVLMAQRAYFEMRSDYVQTVLDLRKTEVEIAGLLLVDGLTEPPGPTPGGHIDATPKPR